MIAKEYLKQAYRLDQRIEKELLNIKELRYMASSPKTTSYGERVQESNQRKDAYFVKVLEKVRFLEERTNQQIDKFYDLKLQMQEAIDTLENMDHNLVLSYRYIHGLSWEDIAVEVLDRY